MSQPDLLTVSDVAERLRIPRASVYDRVRDGRLPGVVRVGRLIRIKAAELESWIRDGGDSESGR